MQYYIKRKHSNVYIQKHRSKNREQNNVVMKPQPTVCAHMCLGDKQKKHNPQNI